MVSELILAWYNSERHAWVPVGRLEYLNNKYFFRYTSEVESLHEKDNFRPLAGMDKFETCYESDEIFPLFKNRLLQKNRPEYQDYLSWLNIEENEYSPIEELSKTGGIRSTDHLRLFPIPKKQNDEYAISFFSYGIRYLSASCTDRLAKLNPDDKLYLMKDFQNKYDGHALLMRSEDPIEILGYVPRFFAEDFEKLIDLNDGDKVSVTVEKVNLKSPSQYKLLCKCRTTWPDRFVPFSGSEFQHI
ncbi:HIRAN domain-containing protein [Desulfoluna sp.]|uniref:HIRAN domain-containing protein n=1 Tax=Desulfoluna sp. TaxID=2045199 RepID=UPI00261E5128|nr:HIRAN domain-containing protein [Desulfoluna sp.]